MRLLSIALSAALVLAVPATARAYTVLQTADQNGNGWADTWILDDNGDGVSDRMLIDGNENGVAEVEMGLVSGGVIRVVWMDANLDGHWDTVIEPYYANNGRGALQAKLLWRDANEDGIWENRYYDSELDNYYEWVMVDTNRDGHPDQWVGNSAPAGQTATDVLARQVAPIEAVNILRTAGLSAFFPVSSIPLGG